MKLAKRYGVRLYGRTAAGKEVECDLFVYGIQNLEPENALEWLDLQPADDLWRGYDHRNDWISAEEAATVTVTDVDYTEGYEED